MNRNYIILTFIMILLAVGTVFLSTKREHEQIEPAQLLAEITQPTRFVTTDQVAKLIINHDPSLLLIDVRSADEYEKFSLPGAISLPIDSLMSKNYLGYLGIRGTKAVFYSDDDIKADQAWVLAKRLGFDNIYVMKGGLNCWMETIIRPEIPDADAPKTAWDNYSFRKGASMYFTGAETGTGEASKVKIEVKRREKSSVAAGGC